MTPPSSPATISAPEQPIDLEALAGTPREAASPADLDLVELASLGAPLPGLRLQAPYSGSLVLTDPEGTPVALVQQEDAAPAVRLVPLRPLAPRPSVDRASAGLPQPGAVTATTAVVYSAPPVGPAHGVPASTDGPDRLVLAALVGRSHGPDVASARLLDALRAAAAGSSTGPEATPVVAVPWSLDASPRVLDVPWAHDPDRFAAWLGGWLRVAEVRMASGGAGASAGSSGAAAPRAAQVGLGQVVLLTGLSGSGKSTIARGVEARLEEDGRAVTLLDGDEVRALLSAGLGFDARSRSINVRRIGWVASLVARHGGIAIAAPIAPFAADREEIRRMTESAGGRFTLVHVATPLEVCEARDRKGMYAAARAGRIPEFTGISSPYEEPDDADLVLDTSVMSVSDAVEAVLARLTRTDPS